MILYDILSTLLLSSDEYFLPICGIQGGSFMQNSPVVKTASGGVVKSENDIKWQKKPVLPKSATRTNFAFRVSIISRLLITYSHTRSDTRDM